MRKQGLILASLLLIGCDGLPRDPDGTARHIAASGEIRVGVVRGAESAAVRDFLARLEASSDARAQITAGPGEVLLDQLERGQIDAVIGPFAQDSPWDQLVYLTQPLDGRELASDAVASRAALRHGENAWIMRVETLIAQP